MRVIASHTGLRGVAALLVVFYHLQFGAPTPLPVETALLAPRRGYLAVDLFFILSGFIISYVNRADRKVSPTTSEVRGFLAARFARLYPLLAVSLVTMVMLAGVHSLIAHRLGRADPVDWRSSSMLALASQAMLLNAWLPAPIGWNVPTWSISAEVGAYLLFPICVVMLTWQRWATVASLAFLSVGFYSAVLVMGGVLDDITFPLAPLRCLAGFAAGMLLFLFRRRWAALSATWLGTLQAIGLIGTLSVLALPIADPIAIPFFIILVGSTWTDCSWLSRVLSSRPVQKLGLWSYSIYLMHVTVLDAGSNLWLHFATKAGLSPNNTRSIWLGLAFALVIGVAAVTYRYVERPGRQWVARRLTGHRLRSMAEAPALP